MANGRKRAVTQRGHSAKRKATGKPFAKGNPYVFKPGDPRINRNGAPRTHKELEDLIQAIGAEQIDGTNWTRIEAKIRQWYASQKPQDSQNVIEHGWGKVPQAFNVRTWRDDIVEMLKAHQITPEQVREDFEDDADSLIAAAGLLGSGE